MNNQEIFQSLRSASCPACTGPKKRAQSFCRPCYMRLPLSLQNALYDAQGYVDTFRSALEALKQKSPLE